MKAFFLSLFLFTAFACVACLNEHHVTKYGKESIDGFYLHETYFYKQHNKAELEEYIKNLQSEKPETTEDILTNKNSIAVSLIKLGRLNEAEKILDSLYKKHPDDYSVTINLGTLYELQGKDKKALEYIKQAMTINPESHGGSEWFHIRVLEFKLKNVPANKIPETDILKISSLKKESHDIAGDIRYQLEERIPFTPAPNLMMAKILDEYASFLADSVSIKGSYIMYGIAMDYDRNDVLKLKQKQEALKPLFKKYKEKLPVTGNYYLDRVIETATKNSGTIVTSLLDKGLNYFKEQEEERKKAERQKQYLIWGGVGLFVLAGGVFIYKKNKQR